MSTTTTATTAGGLIDLSKLSLKELLTVKSTALDYAVSKVVAAAENHPTKGVSAFNSAV